MKESTKLAQVLIWGVALTTIVMTPFNSFESFNISKMAMLTIFGSAALLLFFQAPLKEISQKYRAIFSVVFVFVFWSILTTILSDQSIPEKIYGVTGRNTGLLAYLCLSIFLIACVIVSESEFIARLVKVLILSGIIIGIYGGLQGLNIDFFDWRNKYSPVFGVFGNPNFHASFMGMVAVTATGALVLLATDFKRRIACVALILLSLFNIYKSQSLQGFIVFAVGTAVIFYFVLSKKYSKPMKISYLILVAFGFFAFLLDILQKAPWAPLLYKDSVSYRGDFWRSGWNMTLNNPIFGVGLDSYRDYYRIFRDEVTASRPDFNDMTDSAHNVFLDISSGGGFPLLFLYASIIVLAFRSAFLVIRNSININSHFIILFAVWICYLAQSFISINHLGLAVWGWVIPGAIIGYEKRMSESTKIKKQDKIVKTNGNKDVYESLAVVTGVVLGLVLALPPYIADVQFRSTVGKGVVPKIEASAYRWPQSVSRMVYVSEILRKGNLPDNSLVVIKKAIEFNPRSYEIWQEYSLHPNITPAELAQAKRMMKKLDPLNPGLQ